MINKIDYILNEFEENVMDAFNTRKFEEAYQTKQEPERSIQIILPDVPEGANVWVGSGPETTYFYHCLENGYEDVHINLSEDLIGRDICIRISHLEYIFWEMKLTLQDWDGPVFVPVNLTTDRNYVS